LKVGYNPALMGKSLADFVNEALTQVQEVTPSFVAERAGPEGFRIIDVREQDEFDAGHIPGAELFPRGFLEVRADLVHPKRDPSFADRSQKIICYCGGGHRSALAAKALLDMGFEDVRSMSGGWTGWTMEDYPIEK
jgi:rhodanese-related sulfurtransferase